MSWSRRKHLRTAGPLRINAVVFTAIMLLLPGYNAVSGRTLLQETGKLSPRPNVVLIMADDVGRECFGCCGSEHYKTPNIDRLAQQGIRFEYCFSQPLCTPSRVKLMTGLSNVRNYVAFSVLGRDQKTIGQYFQEAGYKTAVAGKWQLYGADHYPERFRAKGTLPQEAGFDRWCLWQVDKLGSRYQAPLLNIDGTNQQFDESKYGPDVATQFLCDFIREQKNESFFVYYPMILAHDPFVPTPESEPGGPDKGKRYYADMVQQMDRLVERIKLTLVEEKLAEKTLLLFTTDNGTHRSIQSPWQEGTLQGGKNSTTAAGMHVPLIAWQPETVQAGTTNSDLIDFSDFLPTLLQATGQTIPTGLDGVSFLAQLHGQPGKPRSSLHCFYCPRPERTQPIQFVYNHRWKLYADGRFFDWKQDPQEQMPITEMNETQRRARDQLRQALTEYPREGQALLKFPPR